MGTLIVGIDVGGSTTKAVAVEGEVVGFASVQTTDPVAAASGVLGKVLTEKGRRLRDVQVLAVSGGGARQIGDQLLDLPIVKVDEISAIGVGGLALTGKSQALVVSMGTGTALVAVYEGGRRILHVGGTGVGGGTLQGLSKALLRKESFEALERMAQAGDPSKVDLTVGDIAGGPVGVVPASATASNFGKLSDEADENDIAAALVNMVGQVIGMVSVFAAKAYRLENDVILVGKLAGSQVVATRIMSVAKIFGVNMSVPRNFDYCTAIGAAAKASPLALNVRKDWSLPGGRLG
ncbi:MAG: pantothenate kinase [Candidatus Bathyarchaeia archaeon]